MNKNDYLFITSTPRPFSSLSAFVRNRNNEHNKLFSNISLQNATINEAHKEKLIHNMFISAFGGNSKLMNYLSKRTNVRDQPLVKMLLMSPRELKLQEQKKLNELKLISPRTSEIGLFKVQRWVFKKDNSKNDSNSNNRGVKKYTKIKQLERNKSVGDMNVMNIRRRIIIKGRSVKSYYGDKKGNNVNDSSSSYSKLKYSGSLNSSSYSSCKYGLSVINGYHEWKNISVCIRKKNKDIKYLQGMKRSSIANSKDEEQGEHM